jgi:hypothetical protein
MLELKETDLAQPLFALAIACYVLLIVWAEIRKRDTNIISSYLMLDNDEQKEVAKGRSYRLLILGVLTLIICFRVNPAIYDLCIPLGMFDQPVINILGVATVFVSLAWTAVMQLEFDQKLFRHKYNGDDILLAEDILHYSRRIQLGYFLVICGVCISLVSVLSFMLLFTAVTIFTRRYATYPS